MVRFRLHGTQGECGAVSERLRDVVTVLSAAGQCRDRGPSVYLEVEAPQLRKPRVRREG